MRRGDQQMQVRGAPLIALPRLMVLRSPIAEIPRTKGSPQQRQNSAKPAPDCGQSALGAGEMKSALQAVPESAGCRAVARAGAIAEADVVINRAWPAGALR